MGAACFMAASCPTLSMTRTSNSVRGEMSWYKLLLCYYIACITPFWTRANQRNQSEENTYLNNRCKPRDSRCCDDIALPWTTRHVHQLCDLRAERCKVATKMPDQWCDTKEYDTYVTCQTCYIWRKNGCNMLLQEFCCRKPIPTLHPFPHFHSTVISGRPKVGISNSFKFST